jgi:hypothetical protein
VASDEESLRWDGSMSTSRGPGLDRESCLRLAALLGLTQPATEAVAETLLRVVRGVAELEEMPLDQYEPAVTFEASWDRET